MSQELKCQQNLVKTRSLPPRELRKSLIEQNKLTPIIMSSVCDMSLLSQPMLRIRQGPTEIVASAEVVTQARTKSSTIASEVRLEPRRPRKQRCRGEGCVPDPVACVNSDRPRTLGKLVSSCRLSQCLSNFSFRLRSSIVHLGRCEFRLGE